MKLKLGDVTMMQQGLTVLLNQPLPIKLSYKLGKLVKIVDEEIQEIENRRIELVKKYGVEDKEKGTIKVSDENQDHFMKEYSELLDLDVNLDFEQVDINQLPDDIKISPQQLIFLDKIIKQ